MRFGAYETAPQRVHTATGLGLVLSLVLLSCSSRTAFWSGRFSSGHEWVGGGGKSLSFTGVLGQSNGQESHTYRNRFGKTCLFSSDIGPHRLYWATRPSLRVSCLFYDNVWPIQPTAMLSPAWNARFRAHWRALPRLSGVYLNFQIDSELARLPVRFASRKPRPRFLNPSERVFSNHRETSAREN